MVAVGHVQRDVAVVRLDVHRLEQPVIQVGRPLVLDDPARNLHTALADRIEDEPHLALVVEILELLVRDRRNLDIERPLREPRVAVPAVAGLLRGLRDLLAGRTMSISPTKRTSAPARLSRSRTRRPTRRPATSRPG